MSSSSSARGSAAGSTSRAAGGVRAQFSDALNVQLAKRSLAAFKDFAHRPGWKIDLRKVGYAFVLTREEDVAAFEANVALQQEYGVPSRMITAAAARALCPLLEGDAILAAAFSRTTGTLPRTPSSRGMQRVRVRTGRRFERGARCSTSRPSETRSPLWSRRTVLSGRTRSSAPPGRGRAAAAPWSAWTFPLPLCGGRSCSPSRFRICRLTCP